MSQFQFDKLTEIKGESVEVYETDSDEKVADIKIEEVERAIAHGGKFDAFSVILKGVPQEHCPQGSYKLKHAAFGEEELFMSPHAVDEYQICISREIKPESEAEA